MGGAIVQPASEDFVWFKGMKQSNSCPPAAGEASIQTMKVHLDKREHTLETDRLNANSRDPEKTVHKGQHPQEQARGPDWIHSHLQRQRAANTCLPPSQKCHCELLIRNIDSKLTW